MNSVLSGFRAKILQDFGMTARIWNVVYLMVAPPYPQCMVLSYAWNILDARSKIGDAPTLTDLRAGGTPVKKQANACLTTGGNPLSSVRFIAQPPPSPANGDP